MLPAQGWLPGSIPRHGAKRTSLLRIFADKKEGSRGCPVPSTGLQMEPGPCTGSQTKGSRLPKGGGEDAAQTAVLAGLFSPGNNKKPIKSFRGKSLGNLPPLAAQTPREERAHNPSLVILLQLPTPKPRPTTVTCC